MGSIWQEGSGRFARPVCSGVYGPDLLGSFQTLRASVGWESTKQQGRGRGCSSAERRRRNCTHLSPCTKRRLHLTLRCSAKAFKSETHKSLKPGPRVSTLQHYTTFGRFIYAWTTHLRLDSIGDRRCSDWFRAPRIVRSPCEVLPRLLGSLLLASSGLLGQLTQPWPCTDHPPASTTLAGAGGSSLGPNHRNGESLKGVTSRLLGNVGPLKQLHIAT